jgi:leader peptidase (prepilin peptidase) / N-methyltransferase
MIAAVITRSGASFSREEIIFDHQSQRELMLDTAWLDRMTGFDAAGWAAVAVAPFIGSFLGVVIRRLPEGRAIAWSRSRCEGCGAALAAQDLIPLLSWLACRGRCRFCGRPLGWFYPAVELAALAIALTAVGIDRGRVVWLDCILGWWLLALGWIDARRWVLPDLLTLPLVVAGLVAVLVFDPDQLTNRALGAALGYLALRAIAFLYRRLRGRDGLGQGDAKLLAASGAWVGAAALPQVILFAALAGLGCALCLRLAGVRLGTSSALPFGPFLALATWFVWLLPALSP